MRRITVETEKPYEIVIGKGILKQCGDAVKGHFPQGSAVIVTDDIVDELYGDTIRKAFDKTAIPHITFVFANGEHSKNMDILRELLEFMAHHQINRGDFIVALGGGVVGDLAGFAASVYLRGIPYVQIPTTFLAAIDSSVGGKTAVNLTAGKNLAGAFHQPSLVWCDHDTMKTMDPVRFADGIAEAVKYAVLSDEKLFTLLHAGDLHQHIEEIIDTCVRIKRRLVLEDEFDYGNRQFLNLGHTLGHAIEKQSDFAITHGHAVACGMIAIAEAATKNGLAEFDCKDRIAEVLSLYHLPTACPYPLSELLPYVENDKKRSGDTIRLVIPETIGKCRLLSLPVTELKSFFQV
jgi:3-dehydroquinate synthase